jgi:hypothetical protein
MTRVHCFVGRTSEGLLGIEPFVTDAPLNGSTIAEHFRNGSETTPGQPAIDLALDTTRLDTAHVAGETVGAFELNEALETLRGTSGPSPEGITIGLVLANRYRAQGTIFGVMFDADPALLGSGGQSSAVIQRQGCAIFLDAIRAKHEGQDRAFREHALFTAIHELGHVFNLWHVDNPVSFMTPSGDLMFPADRPDRLYQFSPTHHEFLERCDSDVHVQPGGSTFGDRGFATPTVDNPFDEPPSFPRLDLCIDVQPRQFWRFEPVEVDLTLAVRGGGRAVRLPREVDPSYARLKIWITEPSGERRLFRPALRCCGNEDLIEVTPKMPYRRDITLFRESGGYTFRTSGAHRLQVTVDLHGRRIRSNVVEVFVRPEPLWDRPCRAIRRVLMAPAAVALLQHRQLSVDKEVVATLAEIVRRYPNTLAAVGIQYALGRSLLRRALDGTQPQARTKDLRRALELLRRVRDHDLLSAQRRRVAERLIDDHRLPAVRIQRSRR